MTSNTEASRKIEQTEAEAAACDCLRKRWPEIHERPSRLTMQAYNRLLAGRSQQARRPLNVDRLLLDSFGSISPAYLFSEFPEVGARR
jgi:hypothetical protein